MKKIECLRCEKQNYSNHQEKIKTFINIRIIPIAYIKANYGSVEKFIQDEKDTCLEADTYRIINSNEYDERYKKYVEDSHVLKAIEIIRNNNNIVDKDDVLDYLLALI